MRRVAHVLVVNVVVCGRRLGSVQDSAERTCKWSEKRQEEKNGGRTYTTNDLLGLLEHCGVGVLGLEGVFGGYWAGCHGVRVYGCVRKKAGEIEVVDRKNLILTELIRETGRRD